MSPSVTDLKGAVQEAAVLSRLIAQAFAGRDGGHGSRGRQPLRPADRSAAGRKVVPLPRHPLPGCRRSRRGFYVTPMRVTEGEWEKRGGRREAV